MHWSKNLSKRDLVCQKISQNAQGRIPWNKGKKISQRPWNKGLTAKEDVRIASGERNGVFGKKRPHKETCTCASCQAKQGIVREHKINCQCASCKSRRGEYKGENNPFWNHSHSKKTKRLIGEKNKGPRLKKLTTIQKEELREKRSKIAAVQMCSGQRFLFLCKGHFYSKKNKKSLYYRSSYELKAYLLLEQNKEVVQYIIEPFYIDYKYQNRFYRYVPDILVFYKDGTKELIEVMAQWQFGDARKIKKLSAAYSYCLWQSALNMKFSVWTERELEIE